MDALQMIMIVCPLVFLASTVDAIAGGGGLISLPAYLLTGIPAVLANGSNKMSASVGTLAATIRYIKSKRVSWKPSIIAAIGALPGSFVGAEVLRYTPDDLARWILIVVAPILAAILLFKRMPEGEAKPLTRLRLAICFVVGLTVGFYDGFFGPGTGTLLIMLFVYAIGMDAISASASAKIVNLTSNVSALAAHIINGNVLFYLAVPAMVCSIAGGYLGSALALKKGTKIVRGLMLVVLAILIVKLVVDLL